MEAGESQKRFYQGILQIAVACHHLSNLNWRGAVILLGEGIGRLRDYQPGHEDIDVSGLIVQSVQLLKILQEGGAEQVADILQQITNSEIDSTVDIGITPIRGWPQIQRVVNG